MQMLPAYSSVVYNNKDGSNQGRTVRQRCGRSLPAAWIAATTPSVCSAAGRLSK